MLDLNDPTNRNAIHAVRWWHRDKTTGSIDGLSLDAACEIARAHIMATACPAVIVSATPNTGAEVYGLMPELVSTVTLEECRALCDRFKLTTLPAKAGAKENEP